MADNVTADAGSGGATFRTDDDGTAHWPYTKLAFGADNTQTIVGSTSSNPLPVALSDTDNAVLDSIQTAVELIDNAISGSEMQVDVVAALPAGSNTIGVVDLGATDNAVLDSIQTAVEVIDNIVLLEDSAHNTGDAGVQVFAVRKDTQVNLGMDGDYVPMQTDGSGNIRVTIDETDLTHAEDAVHNSGDMGVMSLAVRNDTLAALAGADGDYSPLQVNASGALFIQEGSALDVSAAVVSIDDNGGSLTIDGTVTANLSATDNAVLDSIQTAVELIDNAISGSESAS